MVGFRRVGRVRLVEAFALVLTAVELLHSPIIGVALAKHASGEEVVVP
jgi:hypothetical protein